jgi:heat shock protein HtpX
MSRVKSVLLLGFLTGLFLFVGDRLGGSTGMMIAFVFAAVSNVGAWWFSDKIVLAVHGAQELDPARFSRLYTIAQELALREQIPVPRLYIVSDPAPNAFATGRNPSHAALAVTTGILDLLDEDELRGVLAHEMSHIRNRDTLITTIAATLAGAISMLARLVFWFGIGNSRERRRGGGLEGLALMIVAPLIALLLQLSLSRTREFRADATGAETIGTGDPLARALLKIERSRGIPSTTARPAFSSLYFSPLGEGGIARLFSTHPSTADRIARLRKLTPSG